MAQMAAHCVCACARRLDILKHRTIIKVILAHDVLFTQKQSCYDPCTKFRHIFFQKSHKTKQTVAIFSRSRMQRCAAGRKPIVAF